MTLNTRRICSALTMIAIVSAVMLAAASPAEAKLPSRWRQRDNLRKLAVKMSNNSLRYLHTTWYWQNYTYSAIEFVPEAGASTPPTQTLEALVPYSGFYTGEVPIRQQASALYATAIALDTGYYDPAITGVPADEALRRTVAWTTGLAESYRKDDWGGRWQTPLWVYYMGYGAKRVWPSLPERTRALVTEAVEDEANHLLDDEPGYYRDAAGWIVNPGDSQSEENAWRAALLVFAAREFPGHPNAGLWEEKGRVFLVNAYASPDQVGHRPEHQGQQHRPERHGDQPQPHPSRLHGRARRDDLEARDGLLGHRHGTPGSGSQQHRPHLDRAHQGQVQREAVPQAGRHHLPLGQEEHPDGRHVLPAG